MEQLQAWSAYWAEYNEYWLKMRRRKVLASLAILLAIKKKKRYRKKRVWITPFLQERREFGAFYTIFERLQLSDAMFISYCRLTKAQFDELLTLIAPLIQKNDYIRAPIEPAERLLVTFRYLASGDSMMSLKHQFHIAQPTISTIISETCEALWTVLAPIVLVPPGQNEWKNIAEGFESNCQFPNCIGAVGGKRVAMQSPANSGSRYYNYKGYHSIVLLAACDSRYCFRFVDIGAQGGLSDRGIWRSSEMGKKITNNEMNIPSEDHRSLPYVFVADEAFPLSNFMLRPYPGRRRLSEDKAMFNYRLSQACKMIENTFGILVAQWRIYRKPIIANVETVANIVKATVCLHNFLRRNNEENEYCPPNVEMDEGGVMEESEHEAMDSGALQNIKHVASNNHSQHAANIRIRFMNYFINEGAGAWQDEAIKR